MFLYLYSILKRCLNSTLRRIVPPTISISSLRFEIEMSLRGSCALKKTLNRPEGNEGHSIVTEGRKLRNRVTDELDDQE